MGIVESKHADADSRTHASSSTLYLESVAILLNLLDFHCDIPSRRWRIRNFTPCRSFFIFLFLDHLFEVLNERATSSSWRILCIFLLEIRPHVAFEQGC